MYKDCLATLYAFGGSYTLTDVRLKNKDKSEHFVWL